jgi:hypothetical protein
MASDDSDAPIAEDVLQPEPFPYCAELVLAQYVLRQRLKEAKDDA